MDPLATGILIIGVGSGTKLLGRMQQGSKVCNRVPCTHHRQEYVFTGVFGKQTNTFDGDLTAVTLKEAPWDHITREMFEEVLKKFKGDILQTPPA